ncbi:MAG: hypothetical protein SVZ03_07410 [Spirochaetota bacterium]|nr:hypothetical protein [Spirochaetota bacterium]
MSWYYKHPANYKKGMAVASVNIAEGYSKELKMITPVEVLYEED